MTKNQAKRKFLKLKFELKLTFYRLVDASLRCTPDWSELNAAAVREFKKTSDVSHEILPEINNLYLAVPLPAH